MPDNVTALLAMSGGGSVDPEKIAEVASEWLEENLATPSTPPIDSSLTVANAAADAKAAGDAIRAQNASLISPTAKQALLDCFAHVAWVDDQGQEYYDALEAALFTEAELQSISAVYTQSGTVYDTDSLDSLKADLVVTALYGDGSTQTVPAESYTLTGTLTEGTSTITVSYGGKTATFDVTVTHRLLPLEYQQVEWIGNTSQSWFKVQDNLPTAFRIEAKTQIDGYNANSTYGNIAAAFQQGANTYGMEFAYKKEDNTVVMFMGAQSVVTPTNINDVLTIGAVCTGTNVKAYIVVNGERVYGAEQSVTRNYTHTGHGVFYAGDSAASVNQLVGKIYYLELYNGNDEIIERFIPCYRKSDNVIGMYEMVTGTFYSNAGTGTFTKGADV